MKAQRWIQLGLGILGMVMVANYQYGWTLFVNPINEKYRWGQAAIQVAFSLFVLTETWLVPFEAYLVDRFGPRLIVAVGGILVGIAWVIDAFANSLTLLYLGGVLSGTGAGIVYGTAMGTALKWFPDRRGLAAGLTAAGFGAGSALTIIPISMAIQNYGYEPAFLYFGLFQGAVVFLSAFFLRSPKLEELPTLPSSPQVRQTRRNYTPIEMLKTGRFWLLYVMMTMMATGGLLATAQIAPLARDYRVAEIPLPILGVTLTALQWALSLDRVMNGITRPFFGWVSDHIGRENTMFIAFSLEGLAISLLLLFARNPFLFVVLTGLTFFAWGEIYSLFPATVGDLFGWRYATTNYGLFYTAKGTASLLVPIGSLVRDLTGSWEPIFMLAIAFDFTAALLAMFVLKRVRSRALAVDAAPASA
jgi:OFA family oxalate/formate antiporter-like MFS transporter